MTDNQEKVKVLIVEDEDRVVVGLEPRLKNLGYTVCCKAASPGELLGLVEEHKFDLVMMVILQNGEMSGVDFAKVIWEKWGVPVVFLIDDTDDDCLELIKWTYPINYIRKPVQDWDLTNSVTMALYVANVDSERRMAEEALQKADEKLERKVKKRNAVLLKVNEQLKHEIENCKRAEEKAQENEKHYHRILDQANALVYVKDVDERFTYINKKYEIFSKLTRHELIGYNSFDLLPEAIAKKISETHKQVIKTRNSIELEEIVPIEGVMHTFLSKKYPLVNSKNQIYGIGGISTDITDRKHAEEALRESEQKYKDAQMIAEFGHYVFNLKTGYWTSSAGLDEIFGTSENLKKDFAVWLQIVHPDYRETMQNYFQINILSKHQIFDKEYKTIDIKNGQEKWVHGLGRLKFDDNNNPVEMLGTIQDITKRKQAEEERMRTIAQLQDALSEVKTLQGFIPICANCKQIRDDKGYWNQIEIYIQERSDAQFSHSICPDCAKKLYPEFYKK